jgi:hypothetical protein
MPFSPGQSGNPAGRLAGTKNRKSLVLQEFEKEGSEVARVVTEKAKAGDMQAASLVLTRLEPPLRPRAEKIQFELDPDAPIADQAKAVVIAVSRGEIDPDTCKLLFDCLTAYVGLKDVETFIAQLNSLRDSKRVPVPGGVITT